MQRYSLAQTVPGVVVVAIGIGFLLDSLGLITFGSILSVWWPLILVFAGIVGLINGGNPTGPLITLAVGVILQLWRLDILEVNIWAFLWPAILIVVGISMLLGRVGAPSETADSHVDVFAAFGGNERRVRAKKFQEGAMTALFGGTKLDLRETELAENARVQVTVAFGGTEILVPRNCAVSFSGLPLFGGWQDKTEHPADPTSHLHVTGTIAFGGLEVKN